MGVTQTKGFGSFFGASSKVTQAY